MRERLEEAEANSAQMQAEKELEMQMKIDTAVKEAQTEARERVAKLQQEFENTKIETIQKHKAGYDRMEANMQKNMDQEKQDVQNERKLLNEQRQQIKGGAAADVVTLLFIDNPHLLCHQSSCNKNLICMLLLPSCNNNSTYLDVSGFTRRFKESWLSDS